MDIDHATVLIQCWWRCVAARRRLLALMWARYELDIAASQASLQDSARVLEGLLIQERIDQDLERRKTTQWAQPLRQDTAARTIQHAYRSHRRRLKHIKMERRGILSHLQGILFILFIHVKIIGS